MPVQIYEATYSQGEQQGDTCNYTLHRETLTMVLGLFFPSTGQLNDIILPGDNTEVKEDEAERIMSVTAQRQKGEKWENQTLTQ